MDRSLIFVVPYLSLDALVQLCMTSKQCSQLVLMAMRQQKLVLFDIPSDECCASGTVAKLLRQAPRKRIVLAPSLTDFGLFHLGISLALRTFPRFPSSCPESIELDLGQCSRVTDSGMECLLDAHGTTMSLRPLNITRMNLSGVWRISNRTLETIGKLPRLEQLILSRCYKVCDSESQLAGLRGLRTLDMTSCSNVMHPHTLETLLRNNPDLEELSLSRVSMSTLSEPAWSRALSSPHRWTKLRTLKIEGSHALTDACLGMLKEVAPHIRSLSLSQSRGVTSLKPLGDEFLGGLEHLELNGCRNLLFIAGGDVATKMKRLRSLEYRHADLDNDALAAMAPLMSTLESLALTGNKRISDEGVARLLLSTTMTKLTELHLGGCDGISPQGMVAPLIMMRQHLHTLQLPPTCDDSVLEALSSTKSSPLEHLDLGKSKVITDNGVTKLIRALNGLRTLRLDETNMSNVALVEIASYSRSLERLSCYGCQQMTRAGFATLDTSTPAFTLKSIMDREGKMVRCACCSCVNRCASSGATASSSTVVKRSPNGSRSRYGEVARFVSMEVPMLLVSCVVIAADWGSTFFS